MRFAAALLLLFLLAGCEQWFPPKKWEESITRATDAWNKREYTKAAELCAVALQQAMGARDPAKVMPALECLAEATWLEGKPLKANVALAQVQAEFPTDFAAWAGRHRLRNNDAVALLEAGRKADAIAAFEAALDANVDSPAHSSNDYRARMVIVTNLGRLGQPEPEGPLGVRLSTEILTELRQRLLRYEQQTPLMLQGMGEALVPIAEIVRQRGDPREAEELLAIAKERREADVESLGANQLVCSKFTIRLLAFESCMREVVKP
ncbi:hypothetical protein [Usitatibacter palustris]|uniref:Tetratricopeptide repeat-containing protein n=1 Tax=Usitatibacter palustris TaxID=2732487 RepID=A0A6M4H2N8_9PROT|nr:hypothetical protein [Usitatibacter palustris]QJR13809.1 hypothetical protein DSM104440_00599 [Usitatibacter palustris]